MIKREWFEKALNKDMKLAQTAIIAGLDVAEHGLDETVLFNGHTDGRNVVCDNVHAWSKQGTMQTVSKVAERLNENTEITVDATGVGSGVYSRLEELNFNTDEYKGGRKPRNKSESEKYRNMLAMGYWNMREMFEQGRIDLHKLNGFPMELAKLKEQLMQIRYEIQSDKQIKIIKPKEKSPDYSDSLMLMCIPKGTGTGFIFMES